MTQFNNLPLYYADVNEAEGIEIMSLVEYPAIEVDYVRFAKEFRLSTNDEKRIVCGPALIPDKPIYRRNDDGYEYYITFTKESIRRLVEKFFQNGNQTSINLEHSVDADNVVIFESYIVDKARNICPVEFSDLPDGTWVISAKINSDEVWEGIKAGKYNGFSIEGVLDVYTEPQQFHKQEEVIDSVENLLTKLN